jgi:type I restriction enzyme R subunit
MIEFKQIIGRGTRLFEGKDYFTVYDFVEAYKHFSDPDWDGEPLEPGGTDGRKATSTTPTEPKPPQQRIVIKLRDGKERAIQHMTQTIFMSPDGRLMTAQDFIKELFGTLSMPEFFSSEDELRLIWSDPVTRRALLGRLTEAGFAIDDLREVQKLIDAENSDLFDVLEYVAYAKEPVSRLERALATQPQLQGALSPGQLDFIHFVLDRYVETGFEELDDARLPELIKLKYEGIHEGVEALGGTDQARRVFIDFQRHLYATG